MKRFLTSTISSLIFETSKLAPASGRQGLRILTYHHVNDIKGDRLSVHPAEFEKQMEWLKSHGYAGVSVREGLRSLDRSSVAITFDDGYRDNYTNAFPVLKKYGFQATVYVITGSVRKDELDRTYLSWGEIKEMQSAGIEMGSHTASHPRLTSVDLSSAKQEIEQSKRGIEQKLGTACESFCYPGGMWNKEIARLVRESGYVNATTVIPGANLAGGDPYLLKRTEISGGDSLFEFKKKINGAYDFLHRVWQAAGMLK